MVLLAVSASAPTGSLDALQVLTMLRAVSTIPVIILTDPSLTSRAVHALDLGADGYVTTAVQPTLLDARIRAALRLADRQEPHAQPDPLIVGDLVIDPFSHVATLQHHPLHLTVIEFEMLLLLAQNVGQTITWRTVVAVVCRQPYLPGDTRYRHHLTRLRHKLGETAEQPRYLHTTGAGIYLSPPPAEQH
jgi:two-component system, OmpR family, KDP operon response regulator KdpE